MYLKILYEEERYVGSIKSNHTGDCGRNYRMAPDQQYRTFDPGRRICEAEFQQSYLDMFNVVIQLGAIMAVVVIYFHRLNPFSPKKTEKQKK